MLSCKEASRLASQEQDRELTATEQVSLRAHLFVCTQCQHFAAQIDFLKRAMKRYRVDKDDK